MKKKFKKKKRKKKEIEKIHGNSLISFNRLNQSNTVCITTKEKYL